ncbi:MAG: S8 family serine peptidase [Solirubrobacteraceae bacterium]
MRIRGITALAGALVAYAIAAGGASAAPYHILVGGHFTQPPTIAQCEAAFGIECYGPPQIQQAYDMGPLYRAGLNGAGKTIIIVDSFGSPTIQQDLQSFDQEYNLPAPPSFQIITPDGPVNQNDPAAFGWGIETSLDVEYAHTMAPGANILLVETPVAETEGITGFPEIVEAENYVIDHHLGDVITQSFGATEQTFSSPQQLFSQRSAYFNALSHDVTVLASSGDTGAANYELDGTDLYPFPTVGWPASDPLVTGVGGLQLHLDQNGFRTQPDNVWNDPASICTQPCAGSGGLSSVFDRPFFQDGVARVVGGQRGVPDVSLNAAVSSAVNVFMSFDGLTAAFYQIAGTSEASPLFSGIVAIADQAARRDLGWLNPQLYALGVGPFSPIDDITRGNNTVTFTEPSTGQTITVQGYNAARGYDLASGLGEPDGARLVAALAGFRAEGR